MKRLADTVVIGIIAGAIFTVLFVAMTDPDKPTVKQVWGKKYPANSEAILYK